MKTIINNEAAWIMAGAIMVKIIISARRFNRRGIGGLQHFNSFYAGLFTVIIEWVLSIAAVVAIIWSTLQLLFA